MNPLTQLKTTSTLLIASALLGSALLPRVQAVVPPPDGGYPGFNTAEGTKALQSLTTGVANTAAGWYSLFSSSSGSYNTGVGAGTLALNTADENTATGAGALLLNTTGGNNTANGALALLFNTTGFGNTATGLSALQGNTTGSSNTANGAFALLNNSTGVENTANGYSALIGNATGFSNTAYGAQALYQSTGNSNIAVGAHAGFNITTGSNNIHIGHTAAGNESGTIRIGNNKQTKAFVAGINGVSQGSPTAVFINTTTGQLGTAPPSSSRRYKKGIKPMDAASEAVLALKPVRFQYKNDNTKTAQFGLIAEDVAGVNPDLVVRDENGEIYTVRYDAVNAMLLNEFLKEHCKNEEQQATIALLKSTDAGHEATIARLEQQIEALTAGLQKVNAQLAAASPSDGGLEASKAAPRVVNSP